jgi:phospholipid/cholesterol/gamma-HCH transport system permease protein
MRQIYFGPFLIEIIYQLLHFKQIKSISFTVLTRQILFTGLQALGLVSLIALLLGAIIIVEGHSVLVAVGQTEWIYKVLISALVRDLGPVIVGFIIIARSGTAISTELGNMVVNQECDALTVMGISPISYLVVPRVIGVLTSMILLSIYFIVIGFFGGYLVANMFLPLPFADFVDSLTRELTPADLVSMLFKVVVSGFFIAVISCYYGLSVRRSFTNVPQRAIKAVGRSIIAVCIINAIGVAGHYVLGGYL